MKILSIETSCDDTCISILEAQGGITGASFKVLANSSNSQIKIHSPYGGVFPMLAKREHLKNLPILLEKTLREAKLHKREKPIDVIAVTYGPGLEPALWTGITLAQELAKKWRVPVMPVNHMEGHIVSVFGNDKGTFSIPKIKYPILSLLVSGGHTQLVLSKKWLRYEIIGETLDDAVGEAFDKVARMLGLPYPGGPEISRLAEAERAKEKQFFREVPLVDGPRGSAPRARGDSDPEKIGFSVALPRPMLHSKNFDFSYSGLKTAVLYLIQKIELEGKTSAKGGPASGWKSKIALEFENAAIDCLVYKTARAIEKYKIKTVIVAGGVSANTHLRNEMKKIVRQDLATSEVKLLFPTKELSTDNSIMIGIAGYLNFIKNQNLPAGKAGKVPKLGTIKATGNLRL